MADDPFVQLDDDGFPIKKPTRIPKPADVEDVSAPTADDLASQPTAPALVGALPPGLNQAPVLPGITPPQRTDVSYPGWQNRIAGQQPINSADNPNTLATSPQSTWQTLTQGPPAGSQLTKLGKLGAILSGVGAGA